MARGMEHKKHKRHKVSSCSFCASCVLSPDVLPFANRRSLLAICLVLLLHSAAAYAQNLGHKLPGLLGLDAGRIPEPGLYVIDRAGIYDADKLRDRNGRLIGPLNLVAYSNAFGLSYTFKLTDGVFLTTTVGGPIAGIKLDLGNRQQANLDLLGLADPYIQPVRLGWRKQRFELVTSYGIYLPTDKSALAGGSGISSGQITHQFSAGGAGYFKDRTRFLTALASYQLNMRQRGIDITRGDAVQIEGGLGTKLLGSRLETEMGLRVMRFGRCATTAERICRLYFAERAIKSTELGPKPRWSSRQFMHRSAYAMNGTSVSTRDRRDRFFFVGVNFLVQKPQRIP